MYGRGQLSFSSTVSGNVWIHNFSHAERIGTETSLGQEIDCDIQYRYNTRVAFQAGVSAFLPANIMRQRFGGAGTAYWAYLQTSVSF